MICYDVAGLNGGSRGPIDDIIIRLAREKCTGRTPRLYRIVLVGVVRDRLVVYGVLFDLGNFTCAYTLVCTKVNLDT